MTNRRNAHLMPIVTCPDAQVAAALGIYDFVDKRIQELDSQLVEFDKELAAERERLGVEPVQESLPLLRRSGNAVCTYLHAEAHQTRRLMHSLQRCSRKPSRPACP